MLSKSFTVTAATNRTRPTFVMLAAASSLLLASCAAPADCSMALPNPDVLNYHLTPGDKIRVITYDEAQLSNSFDIGADGTIAFPLLGTLPAGGLTAHQLESSIATALTTKGLLSKPSVSVQVLAYRPVAVLGEVNHPGQYPYEPGMTMLDAVALAGGFTYRAVTDHASAWRRSSEASGQTVEGDVCPGSELAPGDVVTISERYF